MSNLRYLLIFAALCLNITSAAAQKADNQTENWKPLYELVDIDLQSRLELKLNERPTWKRLIERKKLAVGVVDMSSNPPRYARVNGNEMMYAASLPKIAIMFAAYASFEDGSLEETDEIHNDLGRMIRVSSNQAATRVLNKIGMEKVQQVLLNPRYEFYDEDRGGGLWIGKAYGKGDKRIGDPIHNISHGATVTQVCRFYYLLANGRLISPARSEQMLMDLSDPRLKHKFVSQLSVLAPEAKVFRKSGSWRTWHSDSVMVRGPNWRNYILVAMVESSNGDEVIKNILPIVESILH